MSGEGTGWERLWSRSLAVGGTTVGYDRLRRPDGERTGYGWIGDRGSAAVVARNDDRVILIEEFRPRLGETVLSCPVGSVEAGESFREAGRRELREETGFAADRVEVLAEHYPVAWLRKPRGVVFAGDLSPGEQRLEDDEFADVRTVPADEALALARERDPATGWTLLPLLLARAAGHL